jgi:GNAT superfamily N-acetyltransferase
MPAEPRVRVRRGVAGERRALEDLQRRASLAMQAYRTALLANPGVVDLPGSQLNDGRVLVAERDGAVVGFAVVLPRDDGDADLDGLFVEPARWRAGVGRRLISASLADAATWGAAFLRVVANPEAHDFYLACGFEDVGETHTAFGPALLMRRPVRPPAAEG